MKPFSITFLIGATNECETLKKTVIGIMKSCAESDIGQIMIVKSKNATPECNKAIAQMQRLFPGTVVELEQTRPFVGGAIRDGADNVQTSHLMVVPGDLGIALEAFPALIEEEKKHPEAITKVSRWILPDAFVGYSRVRKVFNFSAQKFLQVLYHTRLTDLTMPVLVMPVEVYRKIDWKELGFPFLTEFVLCPLRLGVPITEVPARCFGRTEGKSNNSVLQTAAYFKTALRVRLTPRAKLLKPQERSA